MKWSQHEVARSVNEYAILLIRTSIFINGAGALVLIAFMGNIWSTELSLFVIDTFNCAITWFIRGVWLAVVCLGLLFFRAVFFYVCPGKEDIKGVTDEDELNRTSTIVEKFHAGLIFLVAMLSLAMFPLGANKATSAFFEQSVAMKNFQDVTPQNSGTKASTRHPSPSSAASKN